VAKKWWRQGELKNPDQGEPSKAKSGFRGLFRREYPEEYRDLPLVVPQGQIGLRLNAQGACYQR
jgi:hypothetical protein